MNQKTNVSLEIWFTPVPALKWYWLKSILFNLFVSVVAWFYFENVRLNCALWLIKELIWGGRLSGIKLQCFHLNTEPTLTAALHKHLSPPRLLWTPNLSLPKLWIKISTGFLFLLLWAEALHPKKVVLHHKFSIQQLFFPPYCLSAIIPKRK